MTKDLLVTIVTPSYNQGQFIEQTIQSVLNQTYQNIQYIVVDGGSTDNTMDIVNKYKDRIDIIIHEKDKGQTDAINKGFRLAKGELTGWINSDDILYPDCVEKIVELHEKHPDGSILYCAKNDLIDAENKWIRTVNTIIDDRKSLLRKYYSVSQQGSFYNNEILKKINYLDESIYYCMDLDLWLRLLKHGSIYRLEDKAYSGFRIWGETKTSTGGVKFLKDIRTTLFRNGAKWYYKTIYITYYYSLKFRIKKFLRR